MNDGIVSLILYSVSVKQLMISHRVLLVSMLAAILQSGD